MTLYAYWVERTNKEGECDVWGVFACNDTQALALVEAKRPISSSPHYMETKILNKVEVMCGSFFGEFVLHDHYFDFCER